MRDEPKDAVKGPETEAHWTNQKGVGFLRQQDGGSRGWVNTVCGAPVPAGTDRTRQRGFTQ